MIQINKLHIRPWLFIPLILLFILFLRLPFANDHIYNVDEAFTSAIANSINQGGVQYKDAIDHRGPLTAYIYALIFYVFGQNNLTAVHLGLLILVMMTAYLVYHLGNMIGGRKVGYWSIFLFSIASFTHQSIDLLAFHTEWPAAFSSALGFFFCLKYFHKGKPLVLFFAGGFYALAFFSKQPAIFDFSVAILFCFIFNYIKHKNFSRTLFPVLITTSGFMFVGGVTLSIFWIKGALKDFVFYFWTFNKDFYMAASSISHKMSQTVLYFLQHNTFAQRNILLFILFFIYIVINIIKMFNVYLREKQELFVSFFLIFWGGASLVGVLSSGRLFGHYNIMILVPFCISSAFTLQYLFDLISKTKNNSLINSARSIFVRKVLGLLLIFIISYGLLRSVMLKGGNYNWRYERIFYYYTLNTIYNSSLPIFDEISFYIKNNSEPEDKIFVWGFLPDIYTLSDRMHASRYVYCIFLTGLIPWVNTDPNVNTNHLIVPGSWDILMEELSENKPLYIVDSAIGDFRHFGKYPISKFPRLSSLVKSEYIQEKDFYMQDGRIGLRLYKRKNFLR